MISEDVTITQTENKEAATSREAVQVHRLRHDALLVFITMIWGGTFLVVKDTLKISGPFTYLAFTYAVGTLTLALIFRKRLARITRAEVKSGLIIGCFLFAGYALQTTGLQFTTVSKAGFITGLNVPLVPIFALIFLRQRPARAAIVGIILSFIGLLLLSIDNQFMLSIGPGEILIFGAAIAYAMHIINISKFSSNVDATNLTIIQMALTSLLAFVAIPISHQPLIVPSPSFWMAILFMGTFDSALTLLIMNRVQQYVGGTKAALIYALEPLWATLTGVLFAGDVLSVPAAIGCGCILVGMIVGRLRSSASMS